MKLKNIRQDTLLTDLSSALEYDPFPEANIYLDDRICCGTIYNKKNWLNKKKRLYIHNNSRSAFGMV